MEPNFIKLSQIISYKFINKMKKIPKSIALIIYQVVLENPVLKTKILYQKSACFHITVIIAIYSDMESPNHMNVI